MGLLIYLLRSPGDYTAPWGVFSCSSYESQYPKLNPNIEWFYEWPKRIFFLSVPSTITPSRLRLAGTIKKLVGSNTAEEQRQGNVREAAIQEQS